MKKRKDYRVIVYDAFLQDYIWSTEAFYDSEAEATKGAMETFLEFDDYTYEIQLYIRCLGGEWQMFGYIEVDEDEKLYVEECFC